ncbi:MAG: hypothetical protein ACP5QU_10010 [Anaerolineae bacterium]
MTDWELITETIRNAMEAVDRTQKAGEDLRNHASAETFDAFRAEMEKLSEHLSRLKFALEHESTFALDELIDRLNMAFIGRPADHRKTPRIE